MKPTYSPIIHPREPYNTPTPLSPSAFQPLRNVVSSAGSIPEKFQAYNSIQPRPHSLTIPKTPLPTIINTPAGPTNATRTFPPVKSPLEAIKALDLRSRPSARQSHFPLQPSHAPLTPPSRTRNTTISESPSPYFSSRPDPSPRRTFTPYSSGFKETSRLRETPTGYSDSNYRSFPVPSPGLWR